MGFRGNVFLFLYLISFTFHPSVECVVASEWSLAPADQYVMAWINVTYTNPHTGQRHTQNGDVGKFGVSKISPVAASGVVVHVRSRRSSDGKMNHYGCDPLEGPIPDRPWIALIRRGNCNFDKKLENAQSRNAVAMVVYDLEDRTTLEKMGLTNCINCTIPGVFTYKRIGEEIANISDNGTTVEMYITVGETCTRPYSGINRTSVLFVSISFIVLMIISLAWLVFYYVQRFRYLHAKDRLAQRLCNAAKKALAKIPTRNIKLTDKEITGEPECCAVCIEFYASGDVVRTLPCRHEFHKSCVDPWLLEHRTCPFCKMDILKYYGFIFTGSQESILHLDLEDGNLNSSDSRDSDQTPTHEHQPVRYAEATTNSHSQTHHRSHPHSSSATLNSCCPHAHPSHVCQCCHQQGNGSEPRKPSAISLTVVATPRGGHATLATTSSQPQNNFSNCKCPCSCCGNTPPPRRYKQRPPPCCTDCDDSEQSLEESSSDTCICGPACPQIQPLIHREDSSLKTLPHIQSNSRLSNLSTGFQNPSDHEDDPVVVDGTENSECESQAQTPTSIK